MFKVDAFLVYCYCYKNDCLKLFEKKTHHWYYTLKHGYSTHAYNELTLTVKWFSFPVNQLHVVNLTDLTNYAYSKGKSPFPGNLV